MSDKPPEPPPGAQLEFPIFRQRVADRNADKGGRSFYFFDFDDNVMFLETFIYVFHKETQEELALSIGQFAQVSHLLGNSPPWDLYEINPDDSVGVATVDIEAGETAQGLLMDSQKEVEVKALDAIPLGHKIAMKDHSVDDSVIKYGEDIGRVVADIQLGGHVHTQNLKTRRW